MQQVEAWMMIPFGIMLLVIAVAPLVIERFWEKNLNKLIFVLALSIPTAAYMAYIGLGDKVVHQLFYDYLPFIVLLGALFVVTGGIHIKYNMAAKPLVNTLILFIGFNIASFIGTTGAAMLLIRPLLEINKCREYKAHTICFFIALVANCGGVLSPLGDPPLFLLYLRGASFNWFSHLFPEWAFVGTVLLAIYFITDSYLYRKEGKSMSVSATGDCGDEDEDEPLRVSVSGAINIFYIVGIVTAVAFVNESHIPAMGGEDAPLYMKFLREIILVGIILLSLYTTKKRVRRANNFSWEPITEVAILFVGIFVTMTPALLFLNTHAASLGLSNPWEFYYSTGLLSSFLDNAPTAVAFHTVAAGLPVTETADLVAGVPEMILRAISLGAVFFGALTYIGNGPNFMVKAIAERDGVKMPSFFGYMFKFSLVILLPVYVLAQLIFL